MEGFSSLYIEPSIEPNMIVMKKNVVNLQYTGVFFLLLVALTLMVGGAASPWYAARLLCIVSMLFLAEPGLARVVPGTTCR